MFVSRMKSPNGTTPLMTAVYSRVYWGRVPDDLLALEAAHDYAFTLVAAHHPRLGGDRRGARQPNSLVPGLPCHRRGQHGQGGC